MRPFCQPPKPMTKRTALIAGNWKLHGSTDLVQALTRAAKQAASSVNAEILLCPPAIWIPAVASALQGSSVKVGGQDVSAHEQGAYTGEISAAMLKACGSQYVIVGHSERRRHHGESSELVARKAEAAFAAGLTPIVCVGETLTEREAGQNWLVVESQLNAIRGLLNKTTEIVIGYEPVWAIGTGKTATPEQAQEMHALIRQWLVQQNAQAGHIRIIYGGSVKADNAAALMAQPDVDGGLVGGASLDAEEFIGICRNVG